MDVGPEGPINPHPIMGAVPTQLGTNRHTTLRDRIIRPANWRPPTLNTHQKPTSNTALPKVQAPTPKPPAQEVIENKQAVQSNHLLIKRKKSTKQVRQVIAPVANEVSEQLSKDSVMILRPSYKVTDELVAYVTHKLSRGCEYEIAKGDAVIFHARNMLADKFMQSDCEWSLWWDDDMVASTGDTVWMKKHIPGIPRNYPDNFLLQNPIKKLLSHNKTIIGGLYFGRMGAHNAICQRTTEDPKTLFNNCPREEIIPRDWVGTGFLLVHRSVYEAIQQNFQDLKPNLNSKNHWERVWNYFAPTEQQAEDVSFCKRALAAGHQPYVDLSTVIFHLGSTVYGPWSQI